MIGASSVAQLEQNVDALDNLELSDDELAEIDSHLADEAGVDMWAKARVGEWYGARSGSRLRRAGDARAPAGVTG